MGSDWFSDGSEDEVDVEAIDQVEANAKRDAIRRALMVSRTRERRDYWQRELAAERFDEFKPEMRRRVAVEQSLLEALERTETPTYVLLRDYQEDSVHCEGKPQKGPKQSFNEWLAAHGVIDPAIANDPFVRPRMVKIRETMQRLADWKDRNDERGISRETDLLRRQLEAVNQYATDHRRCLNFQD